MLEMCISGVHQEMKGWHSCSEEARRPARHALHYVVYSLICIEAGWSYLGMQLQAR